MSKNRILCVACVVSKVVCGDYVYVICFWIGTCVGFDAPQFICVTKQTKKLGHELLNMS